MKGSIKNRKLFSLMLGEWDQSVRVVLCCLGTGEGESAPIPSQYILQLQAGPLEPLSYLAATYGITHFTCSLQLAMPIMLRADDVMPQLPAHANEANGQPQASSKSPDRACADQIHGRMLPACITVIVVTSIQHTAYSIHPSSCQRCAGGG